MLRSFILFAVTSAALAADKPPGLAFIDPATKQPFFTIDDIKRFDWDQQVLELKAERAMDVELWLVGKLNREFAVQVDGKTVYEGLIISSMSSRSHDKPAIVPDDSGVALPLLRIARTYHGAEAKPDPRFDGRVKPVLAEAKLLGAIDLAKAPAEMKKISSDWAGERDFKVRATLFPEMVRPGHDARVHVFFWKDSRVAVEGDTVTVHVKLKGSDGKFENEKVIDLPLEKALGDGFFVATLDLRPQKDVELMSGAAEVSVQAILLKTAEVKEGRAVFAPSLKTLETKAMKFEIPKAK